MILIFFSVKNIDALQEVAGKINIDIKPGETKSFQWGLISDSNQTITLNLSASGKGSEFLIYPKTVTLEPKQIHIVQVNVTVPSTYGTAQTLTPYVAATELGQKGGPTIINVQVLKVVNINISSSSVPEFGSFANMAFAISVITVMSVMYVKNRSHRLT